MGAAASVSSSCPADLSDITEKYDYNQEIKRQIAVKDATVIREQLSQTWIDHSSIIQLITERSKHQLQLALKESQNLNANGRLDRQMHDL